MIVGTRLRRVLIGGVLMGVLAGGLAGAATDPNELKTDMDKASYIIGTQVVGSLKQQGIDVNVEVFIRGFREAMAA